MTTLQQYKTDLSTNQLIYAPHPNLEKQVFYFQVDKEYRQAVQTHMTTLMRTHNGVGLSANQINLDVAVICQELQGQIVTMFNPQVVHLSADKVLMTEGCLSEPGLFLKIKRPDIVSASWEDVAGNTITETLYGMDARVFLHEFDHLQGIMFTDRVSKPKLDLARKKQKKRMQRAARRLINANG